MARVGIFGGTFNPPHQGHAALIRAALNELGLDELQVVPAARPPHKPIPDDPGPEVRFQLCEAACAGHDGVVPSRVELERDGPSFTVQTLEGFAATFPEDELVLILGEDAAASLPGWRRPDRIVELATIAWAGRPGGGEDRIAAAAAAIESDMKAVRLRMEPIAVSSSMVRGWIAAGDRRWESLVPAAVAELIRSRGLYHRQGQ